MWPARDSTLIVDRTLDMSTPIFFSSYASRPPPPPTVDTPLPTPPIEPLVGRVFGYRSMIVSLSLYATVPLSTSMYTHYASAAAAAPTASMGSFSMVGWSVRLMPTRKGMGAVT